MTENQTAKTLAAWLQIRGWSPEQLATEAHVSLSTINRARKGISLNRAMAISKALQVSISQISDLIVRERGGE